MANIFFEDQKAGHGDRMADFNKKENREQSPIPFLLKPFLSLSYLLHNSMSQELFGEASKRRNKKQEARRKRKKKIEQENWKGSLLMISSTLSYIII